MEGQRGKFLSKGIGCRNNLIFDIFTLEDERVVGENQGI
jgi:hypothetical protein